MEDEDEEFKQLLEEIPQVMESPAQIQGSDLIEKSEATLSNQNLRTQDIAPVFPDLLKVLHPVKDLGKREDDCSYIRPPPGMGSNLRFHPSSHEAYTLQEEAFIPVGFTHSHGRDHDPFESSMDSSLAPAFTNLNLQAEAEGCPALGDGSDLCAAWPGSLNKFHPATGGAMAQSNLGFKLPWCGDSKGSSLTRKSYKPAAFDNADGLLSGRLSHMHPNARVSKDGGILLPHGNISGNTSHISGGALDYGKHLQQAMEPRPLPLLPGQYQDMLLSPNMVNRKGVSEGDAAMTSYIQRQESPRAQRIRQLREDRKLWLEQGHAEEVPNMTSAYFHEGRDHGHLLPRFGETYGPAADRRLHREQQLSSMRYGSNEPNLPPPQPETVYAYCSQGICSGMGNPSYHAKQQGFTRQKDFQLHLSPPFVDIGFDEKYVSPPVKILSRKSSRVAAPPLSPVLGWSDRPQYQVCLQQSAALDNDSRVDPHGTARPNLDFLGYNLYQPSDALQSPPIHTSLAEIEGHIFSVAKDQHGCRFLQKKFEEGTSEDVQKIFSEIIDHAVELMVDPFGNYLMQKLLEVCTDEQRTDLLNVMTSDGELIHVSLNMHGTRAVQKLVETLSSRQQVSIFTASLRPGVVSLIEDLNGNHVIQRCLQHLSNEDNEVLAAKCFIFEAAACHCVEIATHRHGCCVLQRCIDHSMGISRQRLILEISANSLLLAQDPFGNYVVQYILDLNLAWATDEVLKHLADHYAHLSMQKFSSNVVEKCLKLASEDGRACIIQELMDSSHLPQLLQDPYANYVIQSALMASKGALHLSLVEAIRPHVPLLRSSPYGKRILSRRSFKKL